jgi:hypothetical protein
MTVATAVAVMVSLTPALASAQMGGMGGGMGGGRGMGGGGGMGGGRNGEMMGGGNRTDQKLATAKDIEKLNPAGLLIDKRKKMSLDDSTVAALHTLQLKIYERNGDLLARYDSVRQAMPPAPKSGDEPTAQQSADRQLAMQTIRKTLEELMDRRRTDISETLALVPENAKKKAAGLLDDQDEELGKLMPKSGGGDRGGRRGRGGQQPD